MDADTLSSATSKVATLASIEALSCEWLTAAIGGPQVADFTATRIGTGQMADSYRVELSYGEPATATETSTGAAPASVVVKVAASDPTSRASGASLGLYQREVLFYSELAPRIGGPLATAYAASFEESDHTFSLVIGDAAPARQGDEIAGASAAEALAAARALAELHRPVLGDPALATSEWLARPSPITATIMQSLLPGYLERYGDRIAPEHREVCRRFVASFDGWVALAEAAAPKGLVHGDYRLDNLLFDADDGSVTVVDWQTVAYGDAFTDLAYLLGGAMGAEGRRAVTDDVIASYHEALGPDAPAIDVVREGVRRQAFHGVVMSIVSPMMVVRTERGDDMFMTAVARHAQQVLDLDALSLLPEPVALAPLAPLPEDEHAHPGGPEPLFNESWYFDLVDAGQGIGVYMRLGKYENLDRSWFTVLVCGPGRPTVAIVDLYAPLPEDDLSLQTDAFTVSHDFEVPLERARVRVTGTGRSHDDPAALLRREEGTPVDVALDLAWETEGSPYLYRLTPRYEIPCRVRGTLTVGEESFTFDAPGQRDHSWGVRDWWSMGWVWFAVHLDDGTRLHGTDLRIPGGPEIGIGYAQAPGVPIHELEVVRCTETMGPDGLITHARLTLQPGDLELELEPRGHAPVTLEADDQMGGRAVDFPRSWCAVTAADGRTGVAWIEVNENEPQS